MTKIIGICQLIRKQIFLKLTLCNRLQSGCNRLSLKDFPKFYVVQSIAIRVKSITLKDFPKIALVQSIATEGFSKKIVFYVTIADPVPTLQTSYQSQINPPKTLKITV